MVTVVLSLLIAAAVAVVAGSVLLVHRFLTTVGGIMPAPARYDLDQPAITQKSEKGK